MMMATVASRILWLCVSVCVCLSKRPMQCLLISGVSRCGRFNLWVSLFQPNDRSDFSFRCRRFPGQFNLPSELQQIYVFYDRTAFSGLFLSQREGRSQLMGEDEGDNTEGRCELLWPSRNLLFDDVSPLMVKADWHLLFLVNILEGARRRTLSDMEKSEQTQRVLQVSM